MLQSISFNTLTNASNNHEMTDPGPKLTDLQLPPNIDEILGVLLISVMNMLANAGGLGGGAIIIPFMMIFFNLPIGECIPLANSFALISSITRFVINYNQEHPYRPWRKIIDYEVVTLTMPLVYLGTMIGV